MENSQGGMLATQQATAKAEMTPSERFVGMVQKELGAMAPGSQMSDSQRRLAMNYFVKLDQTLKDLEKKRMGKPEEKRDAIPYTWAKINTEKLALDVVAFTKVGLDPLQANHINLIPYANNAQGRYDIGFIPGYRGLELKAKKYGYDVPDEIIVELVYSTDVFKAIKKDINNAVESYIFEVQNDFQRGEIVGGFYYFSYFDNPKKNKLKVYSKADIEKRKPKYASSEFWGGEKTVWVNGQPTKQATDGWYAEMAHKTIARAAYSAIAIDSEKIDDAFRRLIEIDSENVEERVAIEVENNANKTVISIPEQPTDEAVIVSETPTPTPVEQPTEQPSNAPF